MHYVLSGTLFHAHAKLTSLEKDIESQKETLAATEKEYKEKIRILNEEMQSTSKEKLSNKQRASK